MAIDSLGSSTAVNYSQTISSSTVAPAQGDSDGGGTPSTPPAGGRFASAIEQTLAQLGGGSATSSTSSGSSTAQDPAQAEHAFAQSLFSALQSQFGSQQQAQGAQGEGGGHHHHHHGGGGGGGRLASALDSLAQSLTSSAGSSDSTGASGGSTSSASSDLQTSFNNLLAATGQSGSSATLPQFLQSLAQNLQGGSNSGNLLSVKV